MAILTYNNQFNYTGKGFVDAKMMPFASLDELNAISDSELLAHYVPGMAVIVLDDGEFTNIQYVLNNEYKWERLIDLSKLSLSFDNGSTQPGTENTEYYAQLEYNGEILGSAINLTPMLDNVENSIATVKGKVTALEAKKHYTSFELSDTDAAGVSGIFLVATADDNSKIYVDLSDVNKGENDRFTALENKIVNGISIEDRNGVPYFVLSFSDGISIDTSLAQFVYTEGTGIKIENNVISVDETWVDGRIDAKIETIQQDIEDLKSVTSEITGIKNDIADLSGKTDANTTGIANLVTQLGGVQTNIDAIEEKTTNLQNSVTDLTSTVNSHGEKILELEGKVNALEQGGGTGNTGATTVIVDNKSIVKDGLGTISVQISSNDENALSVKDNGLFAQGVYVSFEDEEINNLENA